jgi:PilZ domain
MTARSGHFRAFDRKTVRLRALVTHIEAGWQRQVQVANIALGGACVLLDEHVRGGDRVTLSFVAPTLWDPLVLRARVVWFREGRKGDPPLCGIAFEHKSAQATLALFELIGAVAYD